MTSYKALNINREKIVSVINEKFSPKSINGPTPKGNNLYHLSIVVQNNDEALICLYYNNDGTTTISTKQGKNQKLNERIAEEIKSSCILDQRTSVEVYVHISKTDFNDALNYLTSECEAKIEGNSVVSGGQQYKLIGKYKDKLIIKYFDKNESMQIQGKPLSLYNDLISILCELLPYEEAVKCQFSVLNINRDIDGVRNELQARIPNAYSYLDDRLKAIITPSIAFKHVEMELEDYSIYVMPLLRGLEGYLKQIFVTNKLDPIGKKGFGSYFCFNQITNQFSLVSSYSSAFGPIKSNQVVNIYSYYHQRRHQVFHVDETISTSTILTKSEAADILNEILDLMDSNYTVFV